MSKFSLRLRELRNSKDLSQQKFADIIGTSKSSINMYERGEREPGLETLETIADYFNVDLDYLLGKSDIPNRTLAEKFDNILPLPPMHRVPLIGNIACGKPIFCEEEYSYIETDVKADMCLRAVGDSMINARISDGDIVFIRQQDIVDNGEIAAVIIDDSATLKRVYIQDNYLTLMAENPAYPPIVLKLNENSNIRILGKAVAFQSIVK